MTSQDIRLIHKKIIKKLKKLQHRKGPWGNNNFINAITTNCLVEMNAPSSILKKSALYILSQRKENGTWNYHSLHSRKKYPDDLDDTFCSLIVLRKISPNIPSKKHRSDIIKLLNKTKNIETGAHYTWLEKTWRDVDPIVNANISYYASSIGINLPKVTAYIDDYLLKRVTESKYYHNHFLSYYFISRNYLGKQKPLLIELIEKQLKEKQGPEDRYQVTNQALALCALIRLEPSSPSIALLVEKIVKGLASKELQTQPLYIEKISSGKKHYAFSEAFSLALCGEALSLYKKITHETALLNEIKYRAKKRCNALPQPIKNHALTIIDNTISSNSFKKILLLPHYTLTSHLQKVNTSKATHLLHQESHLNETSIQYGLLSLYGWLAYTKFDRMIDRKEKVTLLPVANLFHREMCLLCKSILMGKSGLSTQKLFTKIFDTMDNSELIESLHYEENLNKSHSSSKIPSKKQTIDKSFGLALPSLSALASLGIPPNSLSMKKFILFFRHFIFIKQMSDDIHDRKIDLEKGALTRITARNILGINAETSAKEILYHVRAAKKALMSSKLFLPHTPLLEYIESHARITEKFVKNIENI